MRISLVTPSYNHARFVRATIDSVLDQSGDFELEYRVIDGASTDETVSILQSYGDRLSWTSEPDKGQVDAVNRGLKQATGDIVGWLNSDDLLLPGALDCVAGVFSAQPECQWLFGDCIVVDADGREIRKWVSAYKRHCALHYSRRSLLKRNFISQMSVFWRREFMDRVGCLDPTLPLAFDYDYWLRMSGVCPPIYVDQKLAAFRWYETSKTGANFRAQLAETERIAERHGATGLGQRLTKRLLNQGTMTVYSALSMLKRFRQSPAE